MTFLDVLNWKRISKTSERISSKAKQFHQERSNFSKDEKVALKDLPKRADIIITNADDYIRKAKHQLNNPRNYKVLAKDPTTTSNDLTNQTIDRFTKQLINENIANGLKNPSSRTTQFYISPKIRKEGNQGCPVISSINWS